MLQLKKTTYICSMNNTRFATAIHIMTILAKNPEEWLSSEWIAGSINVNPVMVRKEIGNLKNAGFIDSKKGKDGGSTIIISPKNIKISEIYHSVKNSEILGKKNQNPNPKCPVGKDINQNLDFLFQETDDLIIEFLNKKTLEDFTKNFR